MARATRYAAGWKLSVKGMRLGDGRFWQVIIGVKGGQTYMFSRHMNWDDAVHRMNVMNPYECSKVRLPDE